MQSKSSLKSSYSTTTETSPDERSSARSQNIRRRNQTRSANQRNEKWVRVKRSYHPAKYKVCRAAQEYHDSKKKSYLTVIGL